ncbi:MAG: fasciclin domain-containing protein, partial [Phototrophicaceae bacterium]
EALLETLGMEAEELLADTELLATVLRYHVVDGLAPAEVVVTLDGAEVNTILNSVMISDGEPVAVDIVDGEVVLNDGQATVVTTDVEADNGIIHVIDGVLIPQEVIDALVEAGILEPAAEEPETEEAEEPEATEEAMEEEEEALDLGNSIAGVAAANENFSLLVAALEATDMVEMLVTGGPFTVFAPTDEAFTALLDSLGVTPEVALGMPELLEPVLLYHVVGGIVLAEDVIASEELPTLLNAELISDGDVITIEVVDGAVVLNDGQATVTDVDIEASNGVIHVIDGVLVPAEVLASLGMS